MTSPPNEVARAWAEEAGRKWVRLHAQTDVQLQPLGSLALDALDVKPGERVVDVGFGAGDTLLQLAARVGSTGRVLGVDMSPPLLAQANQRVAAARLDNVQTVLGDAATQAWDGEFDAVFSRFGVMFFEDSIAAFRNLADALRPAGRLGFVCWQPLELNPWAACTLEAVQRVAPEQPLPAVIAAGKPGAFHFGDARFVTGVLTAAGFESIVIRPVTCDIWFGGTGTAEEACDYAFEIGPAARFVAEAPEALRPAFRSAVIEALTPFVTENGVRVPASVFVVTARRAE